MKQEPNKFKTLNFTGKISFIFKKVCALADPVKENKPNNDVGLLGGVDFIALETPLAQSLNTEILHGLRRQLQSEGEQDFIGELIDTFLKFTAIRIVDFHKALKANDIVNLEHLSHTTKTAAATIGAEKLCHLCEKIEVLIQKKSIDEIVAILPLLESEFTIVKSQLVQFSSKVL
jgi:HPt (histidine-containing phosphotransfer) domain-containing protein